MDITCRRCGEPTEAYYLRHEMSWVLCRICEQPVDADEAGRWYHCSAGKYATSAGSAHQPDPGERQFEPAANGEVPDAVRDGGRDGWYRFVLSGKGCELCYGHTGDSATCPECARRRASADAGPSGRAGANDSRCPVVSGGVPLTFAQLDEMDAASEGELGDYV